MAGDLHIVPESLLITHLILCWHIKHKSTEFKGVEVVSVSPTVYTVNRIRQYLWPYQFPPFTIFKETKTCTHMEKLSTELSSGTLRWRPWTHDILGCLAKQSCHPVLRLGSVVDILALFFAHDIVYHIWSKGIAIRQETSISSHMCNLWCVRFVFCDSKDRGGITFYYSLITHCFLSVAAVLCTILLPLTTAPMVVWIPGNTLDWASWKGMLPCTHFSSTVSK